LLVAFDASNSSGDGTLTYTWDFGDGATGTGVTPNHTYTAAGTYTASLVVTDGDGDKSTAAEQTITVTKKKVAPTATFTADPLTGEAPLLVSFDASASTGEAPLAYLWDFGRGRVTGTATPVHTFIQPGSYTVSLVVQGADGVNSQAFTRVITVKKKIPPPQPSFSTQPDGGNAQRIQFTYTGTLGKEPTDFLWTFGDGATSNEENPVHEYATPGTYSVTIEVTDADNRVRQVTRPITVQRKNEPPVAVPDNASTASGEPVVINVLANDQDENKSGLFIPWVQDPAHGTAEIIDDGHKVRYTSDEGYVGTDQFEYVITDDKGVQSQGGLITVQVVQGNLPPTVTVPGGLYSNGGAPVTLEGSAVDPEGDNPISYHWSQVAGEPTVDIADANQATAHFIAPIVVEETVLTFRLTATDSVGNSGFADVQLRVGTVDPPVATIDTPDQTVQEGSTVRLAGRGFFLGEELKEDRRTMAWTQEKGPTVTLSDPTQPEITFVAPVVDNAGGENPQVELQFRLTVTLQPENIPAQSELVTVTVEDNGVVGIDPDYIPTRSEAQIPFGVKADKGALVALEPFGLDQATNNKNRPRITPIGLVDLGLKPENGVAVVSLQLMEPLADDYTMYLYSETDGWQAMTEAATTNPDELAPGAFFLNAKRDRVTLKLQDSVAAPRALQEDRNPREGLIEFRGGPGQISYPVAASASVGGGAVGSGWLLVMAWLGFWRCCRARISHRGTTATAQCGVLTGVHSVGQLDVVSTTPARPSVATASYHTTLSGLATRPCEKSGLTRDEEAIDG